MGFDLPSPTAFHGGDRRAACAHGEVTDYTWKDWDVLRYREGYRVINNVWNEQAAEAPWRQAVFLETLDGEPAFGWLWDWPAASTNMAFDIWAVSELPATVGRLSRTVS